MQPIQYVVFAVGALGAIGFFVLVRAQRFPGVAPPAERGALLGGWSPGGRVGLMNYTRGLVAITVYERGLLVKPALGRASWIDRAAIRAIETGGGIVMKGTRVAVGDGEFVLWNSAAEHERLVAWWRGPAA